MTQAEWDRRVDRVVPYAFWLLVVPAGAALLAWAIQASPRPRGEESGPAPIVHVPSRLGTSPGVWW